jgi:hypothetical protein
MKEEIGKAEGRQVGRVRYSYKTGKEVARKVGWEEGRKKERKRRGSEKRNWKELARSYRSNHTCSILCIRLPH